MPVASLVLALTLSFSDRVRHASDLWAVSSIVEQAGGWVTYTCRQEWHRYSIIKLANRYTVAYWDPEPYPVRATWLCWLLGGTELNAIYAGNGRVTDATLASLASHPAMRTIEEIRIADNEFGDRGLELLPELPRLRSLYIGDTNLTGKGLRHLARFGSLKYLDLDSTAVDDDCLLSLGHLQNLTYLSLNDTPIGDEGIANLRTLKLTDLTLIRTKLSDAGLVHLGAMQSLQVLWIDENTCVTDAGLKHLENLHELRVLRMIDTGVSPEGAAKLRKALPRCGICRTLQEWLRVP